MSAADALAALSRLREAMAEPGLSPARVEELAAEGAELVAAARAGLRRAARAVESLDEAARAGDG